MSKVGTLVYFDIDGRASPLRMLLSHAKVKWEDDRIKGADWGIRKSEMLGGSVPNWIEGNVRMNETESLLRYFGMKWGYYPKDELEAWKADSIVSFAH
jgi:hypothetical protein